MIRGKFSWNTLGLLLPNSHGLNTTFYLSIVAGHVHLFVLTSYQSSKGGFQNDNAPCHKVEFVSNWFPEHDNENSALQWPHHKGIITG